MTLEAQNINDFVNTFTPWRILVIDDHPLQREQTHRIIHEAGFVADHVTSGIEAIALCQFVHYDLIFIELEMEEMELEMDGFEVCRTIRKTGKKPTETHIVALTQRIYDHVQIQQCVANGLDDCITKPLQEDILKDHVKHWRTQETRA